MKTRSLTPMGSLHPILFFAGMYIVALVFAIFICSALFYSCSSTAVKTSDQRVAPSGGASENVAAVAYH